MMVSACFCEIMLFASEYATEVSAGYSETKLIHKVRLFVVIALLRATGVPSPGEIETPGLHHVVA